MRSLNATPGASSTPDLPTLHLLAFGSVDDGKSTLIARLLREPDLILDEQLALLEPDSGTSGTGDVGDDFAVFAEGLQVECEQDIALDETYRLFNTDRRSFTIADYPGHAPYTRNMFTNASRADLAILLVDARKGLQPQTHRHATIVSLFGIRHVVLAVNEMDLVDYDRSGFDDILTNFGKILAKLSLSSVVAIPISAHADDNISTLSLNMSWYPGPSLLDHLEKVACVDRLSDKALRFPIQGINGPDQDFPGFAGTLASGRLHVGDEVLVASSGKSTRIARIVKKCGDVESATARDSVTLTFTDEIGASRGDVLCTPRDRPIVADRFAAHLIWMGTESLLPGRSYLMKIGTRTVSASVISIKYRLDVVSQSKLAAKTLALDEIGQCAIATSAQIALDSYADNGVTGAFILIDRISGAVAGAGMINFVLRRALNVHRHELAVTKSTRARTKGQRAAILWFTGLSGAGKSTIANIVDQELTRRGAHTFLLDGDNIRHGLNRDLGFTQEDRVENIRRVAEVAKLMAEAGLIVLCAFISPFTAERLMVRELVDDGEFVEIFIDTPLDVCKVRDPKGLYRKALAGEIRNFTGIDQPYEPPLHAEIVIGEDCARAEDAAERIISYLDMTETFSSR